RRTLDKLAKADGLKPDDLARFFSLQGQDSVRISMDDVLPRNFLPIVICSNNSALHAFQSAKACDFTNKTNLLMYPSFADVVDSSADGFACLFPKLISNRHGWISSLVSPSPLFRARGSSDYAPRLTCRDGAPQPS